MHKGPVPHHNHPHKECDSKCRNERLSPALMEMAKRELEEFESQSDEAFLIRAEMDKKLSSL
ncbi:MAG: hypothetical protein ACHQJ6_05285 [Candidatus Berkiellales bacterium]